jgi:uncharacterized protein YndB with AHSA1/START domain
MTRTFDAPRERVWKAWTDPKHINEWWGPKGFTTTTHAMSVRPGGVWRFIMHGPDGTDYPNNIVYTEIVKPERLVYDHGGDADADNVQFQVTVNFVEEGGKTTPIMRMLFESVEECEKTKAFGAIEGGNQTLDRLDKHLSGMV